MQQVANLTDNKLLSAMVAEKRSLMRTYIADHHSWALEGKDHLCLLLMGQMITLDVCAEKDKLSLSVMMKDRLSLSIIARTD